ncbi:1-acyl-sn-glycerol-3-phosphate acyltransferase [Tamilnaduibacter salinus]|uniref:1-acyl-sn-glycerol-3-phosphate acyltransferase n=1 Tax=Tamilnaduibacter salinus TaxID=1484056 RepID=A0A2A2I095_9GAMM|nr:lysophospholipid acyltransferase family protein [Tamilnaduibacter salinus]PAV24726.1 1-acyl-sn-glycerol-3-phosphate acyltransferase [Tamilnaduibacter salinus]PVY75974.1 1-acyl-sn-glycerol-3-phosphate acyltransferase [Tamilnaduibacter salinus]
MNRLAMTPLVESATVARRVGVLVGSILVTAFYSVLVLIRAVSGRLHREQVDRYVREWSAHLLRLVRVKLTVSGDVPDFDDGRRYLILCSHASHYDIPISFVALPGSIRMLAKKELFAIPLLGPAMKAAEFPAIDRSNHDNALADLRRARAMMESGIVLWAAPEGTRSKDGTLCGFKKGCFHLALDTDAVIVPVAIRGNHHVLPARTWQINLGQPVALEVAPTIDASAYSRDQLPQLMDDVRQRIAERLT